MSQKAEVGDSRGDRRSLPVVLAIGVALLAWCGLSFAGTPWVLAAPALFVLLAAGLLWLTWGIVLLAGIPGSRPRNWIAVGIILAVAIAGIALNLPVKARFAVSAPAFEHVVDRAGPPPTQVGESDPIDLDCPRLIGLYAIDRCEITDGGYLFYDPLGNAMVDYAGFAYLPHGPRLGSNAGFELQGLVHLQGNWYAFIAGW